MHSKNGHDPSSLAEAQSTRQRLESGDAKAELRGHKSPFYHLRILVLSKVNGKTLKGFTKKSIIL